MYYGAQNDWEIVCLRPQYKTPLKVAEIVL